MDRLTKFYIHKSEVLAERLNALENELNYLKEDAPAAVFKGTGAGQQAFGDSELEDQMRKFKKGGLFQKVEDENQTQEYKDAKAELDRRRSGTPATNPDSSDSWIDRLNVPASEKGDLKAMRLGVIDKFNKGEEPLDSDAATITATGKRIQKEVENVPSVPDAITNAMMSGASKEKPLGKPKNAVAVDPEVEVEDDFVAKERHKGVQGLVKKAFDDVGIGAAGINVEGPAAPRETKATSSDVQQFANRLLNPLANIPMAKGARSAKPYTAQTEFAANAAEAGGEYKTDRSGYLQSVYEPETEPAPAPEPADVRQFANRLLNPLANIPMAKGARSAKPVKPQTEFAANAAEAGGEYKTDRSGYLQSVYSPDFDTTSSDVQQFANRLLNPLANIPMAKGARSAKPKDIETASPTKGSASSTMTTSGRATGFGKENNTAMQPESTWDEVAQKYVPDNLKGKPLVRKDGKVYAGGVELSTGSMETAGYAKDAPTRKELEAVKNAAKAAPQSAKDYLDRLLLRRYRNPAKA